MLKLRVAAAATALSLVAALGTMGSASAGVVGVGTTQSASSLVDVALGTGGSLLHVRVLGDDAKATVDPGVGPTSAFSTLSALKVTSSILPAPLNNLSIPTKDFESRTPGGVGNFTGPAINLGSLVPPTVASGSVVPVSLSSAIDGVGAHSGLKSTLANVGVVNGLISLDSVTSDLGALGGVNSSTASRSLKLNAISVLNLGALLNGLGINLNNLPLTAVSNMLNTLNLNSAVAGLPAGSTLGQLVTQLGTTLNGLSGASGAFSSLPAPLQGAVNGAVGSLPLGGGILSGGSVIPSTDVVTSLIPGINSLLAGVLTNAVNTLNNVTLLKFNGLEIGAATKAVNDVKGSSADVVGKLGSITVGGINLPALDLSSALSTVTNTLNTLNSTLSGVLGSISPDLANLLHVGFFDKASNNGVTTSGGYVRSLAGITGVNIGINPPSNLTALVTNLVAANGIGSNILGAGGTLPNLTSLIGPVNGLLNGALPGNASILGALAGGASIKVADVSAGSNFAAPVAATPVGTSTLPRTGMNTAGLMLIGLLFAGAGIFGRRWMHRRVAAE